MDKLQFDFILSQEITFAHKGETIYTKLLSLYAPSAKNMKKAIQLQAGFSASLKAIQKDVSDIDRENALKEAETKTEEDKTFAGDEIINLLKMANAIDLTEYYEIFQRLLTSTSSCICKVDDKEILTDSLFESISFHDLQKMLGEYLARFLV